MSAKPHMSFQHLLYLLKEMLRIRRFEEKCAQLYSLKKIRGFLHLYIGEEAIAVGAMQALKLGDAVVSTYREHGHALARGLPMNEVMAEMYGKTNGSSGGRGGSMHIFDATKNFYGGNAIVGAGLPMAVGLAMAFKKLAPSGTHSDAIAVCFFGEGAVAEGEFHESLNLAALWQLPVLFICENNGYAMGTALTLSESEQNIAAKAQGYGLDAEQVDGMNVVDVQAAVTRAADTIRSTGKPFFLECMSYRFRGHSMFDSQHYRDKAEIEQWESRGPVRRLTQWLRDNHQLQDQQLAQIERGIEDELSEAVQFAERGEWENTANLLTDVYTPGARA